MVARLRHVGVRAAVSWASSARATVLRRIRRRRHTALASLVRAEQGRADADIAVLGPVTPGLVEAVRARSPQARVVEVPPGPDRHITLTAAAPVDVILDSEDPQGRLRRFEAAFYQLRPGGTYVVPGGASELGPGRGPLGELLVIADASPPRPLHRRLPLETNRMLALRNRVRRRTVGDDLLLSHDLPDVLVKLRDAQFNAYLDRKQTRHRVIRTIPAGDPPPKPAGTEGPEPRTPRVDRPIGRAQLSLRDYREVVVAPKQVLVDGRILLPDTYRHHQWPVLEHTELVDVAAMFATQRPPMRADPSRMTGTYLHLDNEHRGHFGHLLTESLSRVWSWPEALALDPDARVLVGASAIRPSLLSYERELYEACQIPCDRVVVIDAPVRVERLISGTPMFSHPQYVHPRITETWRQVGDRLAASVPARVWPQRLFVGRRKQTRSCQNGEVVEALFREYGFEVVHPEDYSLGEQAQMFRGAEAIGGYAGSGLFQIAFVPDPTHVVIVGATSYTPRNEYLIAAAHGHRIDAVICRAEGRGLNVSYRIDEQREGPFLRRILDDLPGRR